MLKPLMSPELARPLTRDPKTIWYQRFPLSKGIDTPGERDIDYLLSQFDIPDDLTGMSVLDIGTTNGGVAFNAERQGAERVVAVDIHDPTLYGFAQIADAIGSRVQYVRASIYELPAVLGEQFDLVFFLGVLYHLRHPLLAVDALRSLSRGRVFAETEISSTESGTDFYRGEYRGDSSNWFIPSAGCVSDWFASSGFAVKEVARLPEGNPVRGLFEATVLSDPPEWARVSYEREIKVVALDW